MPTIEQEPRLSLPADFRPPAPGPRARFRDRGNETEIAPCRDRARAAGYHRRVRRFCLSIHAGYTCGRSGACCTAGWRIPVDSARLAALRARPALRRTLDGLPAAGNAGGTLVLRTDGDGGCAFHDPAGRLCTIHRDSGPQLLPEGCRNFPRIALHDPRGTFVTLSHFCPTAAALLLAAGDIVVVEAPASISLDGDVEGLDARDVLPPLLGPGMLMDHEGYGAWEREGLGVLNDHGRSPREALALIRAATEDARAWRPGGETLASRVTRAFARARSRPPAPGGPPALSRATKAFLAAHLFASWAAYQDGGLMAVVHTVEGALALLERALSRDTFDAAGAGAPPADVRATFVNAVRSVDLVLRHGQPASTGDAHAGSRSLSPLRRHRHPR